MIPPVFVDENVGRKLRECLINLGFILKTHDDLGLPRGASDTEWIAAAAAQGRAAITADVKQTRRANEWRAIQNGPLKHVVVHAKRLTADKAVEITESHSTTVKVVLDYLPAPFTLKLLLQNVQLRSYHQDYDAIPTANEQEP